MSLILALGALGIGIVIGVIMAAMKLSHSKILNVIANLYVEILRGTPMLLQILFLFLGLPMIWRMVTGSRLEANPYIVGLIAMSLNSGAYQTELIRSGIQGVARGQWEACETLGISYKTMMMKVILPQAFKRIIPPMVSEFITLIKDSSLISTIGATELLYSAQQLGSRYFNYVGPLLIAGAMYLCMTICVSVISRRIEKRFAISD